jgi:hypothetical protein
VGFICIPVPAFPPRLPVKPSEVLVRDGLGEAEEASWYEAGPVQVTRRGPQLLQQPCLLGSHCTQETGNCHSWCPGPQEAGAED